MAVSKSVSKVSIYISHSQKHLYCAEYILSIFRKKYVYIQLTPKHVETQCWVTKTV